MRPVWHVSGAWQIHVHEELSQTLPGVSKHCLLASWSLHWHSQDSLLQVWDSRLWSHCCWRCLEHPHWQSTSSSTSKLAHCFSHFPPPTGQRPIMTDTCLTRVTLATQLLSLVWQPPLHLFTTTWLGLSWWMSVLLGHGTGITCERSHFKYLYSIIMHDSEIIYARKCVSLHVSQCISKAKSPRWEWWMICCIVPVVRR